MNTRGLTNVRKMSWLFLILTGCIFSNPDPASAAARMESYVSKIDGSEQWYGLYLPEPFDPDVPHPVLVHLHGFGGRANLDFSGPQKHRTDLADAWGWILVNPDGRDRSFYDGMGENDIFCVLDDLRPKFRIDEDRIYLKGCSMGGTGSFKLGFRYPHVFAAIAGWDGWSDYQLFHRHYFASELDPEKINPWQEPLLQGTSPLYFAENGKHLNVQINVDMGDQVVWPQNGQRLHERLNDLGYGHSYNEFPGGHCAYYDATAIYEYLNECVNEPSPKHVVLKANQLKYGSAYWVRIDRLEESVQFATLEASVEDGSVEVMASHLLQYTLTLTPEFVGKDEVSVYTNRELSYAGPVGEITVFASLDESGNIVGWSTDDTLPGGLRKTAQVEGPIGHAYTSKFKLVRGTIGDEGEIAQNLAEAEKFASEWYTWFHGSISQVTDTSITQEDIASSNLILFGTADSNSIIQQINPLLPIRIWQDRIVAEASVYAGDDYGLYMVFPNPLNPERYVVISHGTILGSSEEHLMVLPCYWPDYVVFDTTIVPSITVPHPEFAEEVRPAYLPDAWVEAGFFDQYWRLKGADHIVDAGQFEAGQRVILRGVGPPDASFSWRQTGGLEHLQAVLEPSPNQAEVQFDTPGVEVGFVLTFELTVESSTIGTITYKYRVKVLAPNEPRIAPTNIHVHVKHLGLRLEWDAIADAEDYGIGIKRGSGDYGWLWTENTCYDLLNLQEGEAITVALRGRNGYGEGGISEEIAFVAMPNLALPSPLGGTRQPSQYLSPVVSSPIQGLNNGETGDYIDSNNEEAKTEDYWGYLWGETLVFDHIVYYQGEIADDGGWWTDLIVQSTQDGGETWKDALKVIIDPPYDFSDSIHGREAFCRFDISFKPVRANGIRLYGVPGGAAGYTSIAELEAYGDQNPKTIAVAGENQHVTEGDRVVLDGTGSFSSSGDLTYQWTQVGGGPAGTIRDNETATPTFIAPLIYQVSQDCTLQLQADDGLGNPDSVSTDTVTVTVVDRHGALIILEAENYASTDDNGDIRSWETVEGGPGDPTYVTTAIAPSQKAKWDNGCELSYDVTITTPGDYTLLLRRYADGYEANSCQVGVNGDLVVSDFDGAGSYGVWVWITEPRHHITFPSPGDYTLNIRRRDGGYRIDKLILYGGDPPGIPDEWSTEAGPTEGSLLGPIWCDRTLETQYVPGSVFSVVLTLDVNMEVPDATLVITENLPSGFEVASAEGNPDLSIPGRIVWTLTGGEAGNRNLEYAASVVTGTTGAVAFAGSMSYGTVSDQPIGGQAVVYPMPSAPMSLTVEMLVAAHLRWSPCLEEGVEHYLIYRSTDGGPWEEMVSLTGTSYTDMSVVAGTSYSYTVSACNVAGGEGPASTPTDEATPATMEIREAEDFNYGGGQGPWTEETTTPAEMSPSSTNLDGGYDYFFANAAQGVNDYRPNDIQDIRNIATAQDPQWIMGHNGSGRNWWRYNFDVPTAGWVKLVVKVAAPAPGKVELYWDEQLVGIVTFQTGSWDAYEWFPLEDTFESSDGSHVMRLYHAAGDLALDTIAVGYDWTASRRKTIWEDDFDAYADDDEVRNLGGWTINTAGFPEGAWRLWSTTGPDLGSEPSDLEGMQSGYMISNSDLSGEGALLNEELVSPSIDCTRWSRLRLNFNKNYRIYDDPLHQQIAEVDIRSSDDGVSWGDWINLLHLDASSVPADVDPPIDSTAEQVDFSVYGGKHVQLRWHFYDAEWDYWFAIDDVRVSGYRMEQKAGEVLSIGHTDSIVDLTWDAFGSGIYTVEYINDLVRGNWEPVPGTSWPITETSWSGDITVIFGDGVYLRVRSE